MIPNVSLERVFPSQERIVACVLADSGAEQMGSGEDMCQHVVSGCCHRHLGEAAA